MKKCDCPDEAHMLSCDSVNEYSYVYCRGCCKPTWMSEMFYGKCKKCNEITDPHQMEMINKVDCNGMCLLNEWDENKPRDCKNCSGRIVKKDEILSPPQTEQAEAQGTESNHKIGT